MRPTLALLFVLVTGFSHMPVPSRAALQNIQTQRVDTFNPDRPFASLTTEALLTTRYRDLRKKTGIKLNLFQRMGLRAAQRRYKKMATKRAMPSSDQRAAKPNKLGRIGLILGAAGIVFLFIPYLGFLSFFLAIAAIVLGAIGLGKDEKPGPAIGAIVLGGLMFLLVIGALIAAAAYFGA